MYVGVGCGCGKFNWYCYSRSIAINTASRCGLQIVWRLVNSAYIENSIGNSFHNVVIICEILPSENHFHANLFLTTHNTLLIYDARKNNIYMTTGSTWLGWTLEEAEFASKWVELAKVRVVHDSVSFGQGLNFTTTYRMRDRANIPKKIWGIWHQILCRIKMV